MFLDDIHYPEKGEGQVVKKAIYITIDIRLDGMKEVMGMWAWCSKRPKSQGRTGHTSMLY